MPEFLSDDWITAFDELVSRDVSLTLEALPQPLGISHTVTGCPGDRTVSYSVVLSPDGSGVRRGPLAEPTVTFSCDYPTAVAVSRGDEQTQMVFLDGRLRIGGDTSALLAARPALAELGDLVAPLRAITTYQPAPSDA
jgi:hypothetical protein